MNIIIMRKFIWMMTALLAMSTAVMAEDHVMAATKSSKPTANS